MAILYVPATQSSHAEPSDPVDPALHLQSVCRSLAAGASEFAKHAWHTEKIVAATTVEYFPVSQLVHGVEPVEFLYLPATHCTHGPPFAPSNPALQVQSVISSLLDGASELCAQL